MTPNDVVQKIIADLAYRTPGLDKPLGHIVLTREEAQVLVDAFTDSESEYQHNNKRS